MRETKSFNVKAAAKVPMGFEGYASTWTRTPDSLGDVVAKGAFAESLEDWQERGRTIPILWLHEMHDPGAYVAKVVDIVEDAHGLKVVGEFFEDDPQARKVHRLLKERMVNEMSFAFEVDDAETITEDGNQVRELRKVDLKEISIVPFGANSDTSIESVKTTQVSSRLTDVEVEAIREMVAERGVAPVVGEVVGKSDEAPEDGKPVVGEAVSKSRDEAAARISKQIDALAKGGK